MQKPTSSNAASAGGGKQLNEQPMKHTILSNPSLHLVLLLVMLLAVPSCEKDHLFDCTKSTGQEVSEYRPTSVFKNIDLSDNVDLVIYPDTTLFIRVTAGQNLIDGIITELDGNTLYIRNENRCNWIRSFKNKFTVEIGMDQPELISYYGSGSIRCMDTLRHDGFTFDSWNGAGSIWLLLHCNTSNLNNNVGSCDINASGISGVSYLYVNGSGIADLSRLETGYSYLKNNSTGDLSVNVTKELGVTIEHTGNIYYTGNPYKVEKIISGSGQLIAR
jgi:hypothetical protein